MPSAGCLSNNTWIILCSDKKIIVKDYCYIFTRVAELGAVYMNLDWLSTRVRTSTWVAKNITFTLTQVGLASMRDGLIQRPASGFSFNSSKKP